MHFLLHPLSASITIHTLPALLPPRPTIYCRYKMEFAGKNNAQHKAGSTARTQNNSHTGATHSSTRKDLRRTSREREGHQHEQTMGRINAHNTRTYLHPLAVDFHEEDAERVGFGGDIPVQKVLATDGQLDLADTVLGADGRRRRGRHGVRHGPRWQQLQALCGTAQGQTSVLAGTKHPASTAELGTHSVATGTASCSQSHTASRLHPPSCSSSQMSGVQAQHSTHDLL